MSSQYPLVSVLMTSYNREQFISEAIESVMNSTYKNWELIISDDASDDKTVQIAKSYADKDERIKLFVNRDNIGDYANRNMAAKYARGEYLKYLDSDDKIFPCGLDVMVNCMENSPSAAMGFSSNIHLQCTSPVTLSPEDAYKLFFFRGFLLGIGPSGTVIRRDIFNSIGGFCNDQFVSDTQLWLKIASQYSIVCMSGDLVFWRQHSQQQIILEKNDIHVEYKRLKILQDMLMSMYCPLQQKIAFQAYRNLLNIKCRALILSFISGNFNDFFERRKILKLSLNDFLLSIKKNRIPDLHTPIHQLNN